jgi:hypothetical protein
MPLAMAVSLAAHQARPCQSCMAACCTGSQTCHQREELQCRSVRHVATVAPPRAGRTGELRGSRCGRRLTRRFSLAFSVISPNAPPSERPRKFEDATRWPNYCKAEGEAGRYLKVAASRTICSLTSKTHSVKTINRQHGQTSSHDRHLDATGCDNHGRVR